MAAATRVASRAKSVCAERHEMKCKAYSFLPLYFDCNSFVTSFHWPMFRFSIGHANRLNVPELEANCHAWIHTVHLDWYTNIILFLFHDQQTLLQQFCNFLSKNSVLAVRNSKVIIPIVPTEFLLFCRRGYCCIHFDSTAKTTTTQELPGTLVLLSVRCFTSFPEQIACSFSSEHPWSFGKFCPHVEPSRNGRKQEVAWKSCCFQLCSSTALHFSFSRSALPYLFAASALVIVPGHAHLQRTRWCHFSSHNRTSRPKCRCWSTGKKETRAVG